MRIIDFKEHKEKRENKLAKRNGWGFGKLFADLIYTPLDEVLDVVCGTGALSYVTVPAANATVVPFGTHSVNTTFGMPR